jgi:hypothetical protein
MYFYYINIAYCTYSAAYDCSPASSGQQLTQNHRKPTPKQYLGSVEHLACKGFISVLWCVCVRRGGGVFSFVVI